MLFSAWTLLSGASNSILYVFSIIVFKYKESSNLTIGSIGVLVEKFQKSSSLNALILVFRYWDSVEIVLCES